MSDPTAAPPAPSKAPSQGPGQSSWPFWIGMDFFAWLRLLAKSRLRVPPLFWIPVVFITLFSPLSTLLRWLQGLIYSRRVNAVPVTHAPLFIIGHWRSGTTLLHDLLAVDPRHAYPSAFDVAAANHFLLSGPILAKIYTKPRSALRGFDNVVTGPDRPQEDEFALALLGAPSPYLTAGFPNSGPIDSAYLDLAGVPPQAVARWKRIFLRYLRQLNFLYGGRRIVFKSPPHTARVKVLQELFPDARFVHIVRNPYEVFPSTLHMQKYVHRQFGLQVPTFAGQRELVFADFLRVFQRLEEARPLLSPKRFAEVRYEELVLDPVGEMRKIYDQLELGDFESVRPQLEAYVATLKGYQRNKFTLDAATRDEITQRWGAVIRRYGYEPPPVV